MLFTNLSNLRTSFPPYHFSAMGDDPKGISVAALFMGRHLTHDSLQETTPSEGQERVFDVQAEKDQGMLSPEEPPNRLKGLSK